jgi:hypothetical protein
MESIPKSIIRRLPKDMSVHGLLAADLALDASDRYSVWNAVCPTAEDLLSMPLLWPTSLQQLLPEPARKLLEKQQAKLVRDWDAVSAAFADELAAPEGDEPSKGFEKYRYAWLLVNTRTFYYLTPKLQRRSKEDRMVLQPVADLFNHADVGCRVAFDHSSFEVHADRAYTAGEELHICYGRHGNDFLSVEYGFILPLESNRWDETGLDDVILPALSRKWKERLEVEGYLGGYVLDRETACFRTQVAVRTLCCGVKEWRRFVDGDDGGEETQEKVDGLLAGLLEDYRERIAELVAQVEQSNDGKKVQRRLLVERWRQVDSLYEMTIQRLRGGGNEK